jgi:prepilin-type processing-associated H-X9-DG protein
LVELLVAIAIIGLIVSLLLPAVQAARESARDTQCRNNMRQIGLALHQYHDARNALPPAFLARSDRWRPSWTWTAFLLPHIEQGGLYDDLHVETAKFGGDVVFADTPTPDTQTILGVFLCPSCTGPELSHRKSEHAKSNYRAVMGNRTIPRTSFPILIRQNGALYTNSSVSIAQILDGSSNTIVAGECLLEAGAAGKKGAIWAGMRGDRDDILYISDTMWWLNSEEAWRINGDGEQAFSSRHPGGAHFLLVDGSVRFIQEAVDGATLEGLASRNDGQVLGDF